MSKYAPHHSSNARPRATPSTVCQKCLGTGHFIFDCKGSRPYVSRPSRTQQLANPKALARAKPSVEVPEEFKKKEGTANKILEARERERKDLEKSAKGKGKDKGKDGARPSKRARRSSASGSDSGSDSESDSDSGSSSSSDSDSGSSSRSDSASNSGDESRGRSRDRKRRR
ncbi:zinc knuckle-domain-containing protein [Schizophyllum amplum]|uniref:Zinc knuckle-domain-containing protein n=1 Tax=Schizophyllum amplum TaxID=97359 RepID=A0A550C8G3_9AGAR|nr:zinc knuckle-domain-containing protein [Auriculariopsis ampla]